jgi:putative ABC transport system permease protein
METLIQDIRFGIRMLLKAPGFSIVATIALALGIGANTAIFSVVNGVLLRPLPYPDSERLMNIWETHSQRGIERGSSSYPNFVDWRTQNTVFERMASYHDSDFIMTGFGPPVRVQGGVVNADLFSLLGVAPMLGRGFHAEEDQPGAERVVVLSQQLFQSRFN